MRRLADKEAGLQLSALRVPVCEHEHPVGARVIADVGQHEILVEVERTSRFDFVFEEDRGQLAQLGQVFGSNRQQLSERSIKAPALGEFRGFD